ncbi:hypothetical protein ACFQL1_01480 [Halomicroarcula sp. GCM10025709]|uniref:hypothetical protein n=2 Tax=Haloarcula TaxID=2237 RepID=UPI0024C2DE09|nr:hypothetical protein [Halomicroarcula sp. YJ-61-S]
MSTSRPLNQELAAYNDRLDHCLRSQYGMSLRLFKIIKQLTQLTGVAAGIYAMSLGAPPLATFAMMAVIITGPEGLEYFIEKGGGSA